MSSIRVIIFSFVLLCSSMASARENPFFPLDGVEVLPYTTNITKKLPPLKQASITLPSQARTIEKVTVTYKTLEGAIEEESIELSNSIDWHLPIFISQSYKNMPEIKSAPLNRGKNAYKVISKLNFITFSSLDKKLKISTKHKLIRDFLLVKPHRIVLDFKTDEKFTIKTYMKKIPKNVFKNIRIGNHKGYFRVVVELDGYYRYTHTANGNNHTFKLR